MAVSIQGIKLFLKRGDMDRVLDVLSKYLRFKKSAHYEFLVRDLLHISFLEGDLEYKKPLQLLDDLTREDYEFNLGKYVLELYQAISEGRCDIARVYLDILNKAKNLGYDFRLGREIELFLEQQENKREENQDIDLKL